MIYWTLSQYLKERKENMTRGEYSIKLTRATQNIANKGFRGLQRFVARLKFGVVGHESSPQSLTADTQPLVGMLKKGNYCENRLQIYKYKYIILKQPK